LGSVTEITDSAGTVVKTYEYKTFGTLSTETGTIENPYTFTGREYDSETGLYYYRARYYDSTLGRFMQKDPIGIAGGLNQYAYVGNNPVNYVDPWGLLDANATYRTVTYNPANNLVTIALNIEYYGDATITDRATYDFEIVSTWSGSAQQGDFNAPLLTTSTINPLSIHDSISGKDFLVQVIVNSKISNLTGTGATTWDANFAQVWVDSQGSGRSNMTHWYTNAGSGLLAAHEAGHLFGSEDHYYDDANGISVTYPNWTGNIMGDSNSGIVQARNIIEILNFNKPSGWNCLNDPRYHFDEIYYQQ